MAELPGFRAGAHRLQAVLVPSEAGIQGAQGVTIFVEEGLKEEGRIKKGGQREEHTCGHGTSLGLCMACEVSLAGD